MKKKVKRQKIVIGRKDRADFPELGLYDVDVKIDTGAYTSSIHCEDIHVMEQDGEKTVEFNLLDSEHPAYNKKRFRLPVYSCKTIKNSFGQAEERIVIKTELVLFNRNFDIELSLSDRSEMKYPVLIGRKLLQRRFVVDVARYDLSHKQKSADKE